MTRMSDRPRTARLAAAALLLAGLLLAGLLLPGAAQAQEQLAVSAHVGGVLGVPAVPPAGTYQGIITLTITQVY